MKKVKVVESSLQKKFSLEVDDRDYSPGWKFNEWELKGVPVRIELGPRDVKKNQVVIVRRDTGKKSIISSGSAAKEVENTLDDIQKSLFSRSKKLLEDNITVAATLNQLIDAIKKGKMARSFFCGKEKCEVVIKEKSNGATARCIPFNAKKGKCAVCSKEGPETYFAKAY